MNTKDLERVLKALANRRRLAILSFLKKHPEMMVGDIASAIRLSHKSTSKHLSILKNVDLVEREQRSKEAFYHLGAPTSILRPIISIL